MASELDHESGWQTMESDPGVFSELLRTLGVSLIVDDLYSLDPESLAPLGPLYALIFLFQWTGSSDESGGAQGVYDDDFPGFFANQVVNNACATIAVLNGICNIPSLRVGAELEQFREFASALDPQMRGEVITSNAFFRATHNSLSPPPSVSLSELDIQPSQSEDSYHFIVYLPYAGNIYELDGLKRAPIKHGLFETTGEGWIGKAREVIEARIATYPPGSFRFNLLAIRDDPLPSLQAQMDEAQGKGQSEYAASLLQRISAENGKREQWNFENSLRRHNHLSTIHELLLALVESGHLDNAVEGATHKMVERGKQANRKLDMEE
ncbi:hypothetical protein BS47DRAFT_1374079 [Hydnum rufescens UP504]|uniref:Ubiquitin carboxyl-terminal hydrolase n=1 Tax=Hydnum rufescens UP504 TaxID=1448309 RepID=A0A9P6AIS2_9AGAM|nr:hypothetical protein BS47DRAFT_1374079 [Hydnum rufescens UP504]